MLNKLYQILKHEHKLISHLNELTDQQRDSLIKFDMKNVEQLANIQEIKLKELREVEEQRIKVLITWLGISRADAMNLRLSTIENKLDGAALNEIKKMRISMKKLITAMRDKNNTNRILAVRARNSVQNILSQIVNNKKQVCNVKL